MQDEKLRKLTELLGLTRSEWFDPEASAPRITYTLGNLSIDCRPGYENEGIAELVRKVHERKTLFV